MFINCMHEYMTWSWFWSKKIKNSQKTLFITKNAPLEIHNQIILIQLIS
jgi:hypothetical protein